MTAAVGRGGIRGPSMGRARIVRLHGGAGDGGPLYALATDDAHDHYGADAVSLPGRGWRLVVEFVLMRDKPNERCSQTLETDLFATKGA